VTTSIPSRCLRVLSSRSVGQLLHVDAWKALRVGLRKFAEGEGHGEIVSDCEVLEAEVSDGSNRLGVLLKVEVAGAQLSVLIFSPAVSPALLGLRDAEAFPQLDRLELCVLIESAGRTDLLAQSLSPNVEAAVETHTRSEVARCERGDSTCFSAVQALHFLQEALHFRLLPDSQLALSVEAAAQNLRGSEEERSAVAANHRQDFSLY